MKIWRASCRGRIGYTPTLGFTSAMSPRDLLADSRVLLQMLRGQSREGTAAERLQAFYAPQASSYDAFRARLLHGREELIDRLVTPPQGTVVELGGGTGSNIDRFGRRMQH